MPDLRTTRLAGLLYIAIIGLGLVAEVAVRQPILALDAQAAASAIAGGPVAFRLAIAADAVMVAADIALAYLLWQILAPSGRQIAALAALFRLAQATVIASALATQYEALLWVQQGEAELALHALRQHGAGYDFGLIFFGICSVLTGILLIRNPAFATWLGGLLAAAGLVYLTGSFLRLIAPGAVEAFAPAYLIAVVAETAFALALLTGGYGRIRRMVGDERFELPTSSM